MGPSGDRRQRASGGARPLGPNRIGLGFGGPAPSFLLPSSSFLPLLVGLGKGEPTPSRSRIPPLGAHPMRPAGPLLHYFIYGGGGTP